MAETTKLLRHIAIQTAPSIERSFMVTSPPGDHTDAFEAHFSTPIRARPDRVLEIAFSGLRTSYSWANVTEINNSFVYSTDGGAHNAYRIDISSSTLRTILGWPKGSNTLARGRHEAPNIVQITSVNEIVVHADCVDGTYIKGAAESSAHQGYVLGSFYPDVPPGYKINYSPRHLNWLRAT